MRYALRWWYISKLLDYGDLRKTDNMHGDSELYRLREYR